LGSGAVYLCDPVLGDDGRTYVKPDVVDAIHNLAALADIIVPNAYELSLLSGISLDRREDALRAMRVLQQRGPQIVLLSSFVGADTSAGMIDVVVLDGMVAWRLAMPRLDYKFSGAGDVLSALFLHFWMVSRDSAQAMAASCAALFGVLRVTMTSQANELALVSAQHLLVAPEQYFSLERLV
jgi:pyridoxine kinase